MSKNIIVVGGGVAGLGLSWKLLQKGFNVTVVERHHIGAGASTKAGGMLAPTAEVRFEEKDLLQLGQSSLQMWESFAEELEAESGVSIDYRRYGTMVIAVDRDDLEYLKHMYTYQQELGLPATMLDGNEARQREPGLSGYIPGALWIPSDHNVDPILLVQALGEAIRRRGGKIEENTDVIEIIQESNKVGILTRKNNQEAPLFADTVVIASGSWTRQIKHLPTDAPKIRPVKGQMVALGNYTLSQPKEHRTPLIQHVLRGPDAYLIPRSDNRIILGATTEEMGWDEHQTAGGVFELLRGAWEVFPGIYDAPLLDMWVGFRPTTVDNDPILRWSNENGIFYATGFGRNGILLTPWAAINGANMIANQ